MRRPTRREKRKRGASNYLDIVKWAVSKSDASAKPQRHCPSQRRTPPGSNCRRAAHFGSANPHRRTTLAVTDGVTSRSPISNWMERMDFALVGWWSEHHKTGQMVKCSNRNGSMDRCAVVVVVGGCLGLGLCLGWWRRRRRTKTTRAPFRSPLFHRHGGNMLGDWAADPIPGKRSGRGRV